MVRFDSAGGFILPDAYEAGNLPSSPTADYIGISKTFSCRWSYKNNRFVEEPSLEYGVAGFFLFMIRASSQKCRTAVNSSAGCSHRRWCSRRSVWQERRNLDFWRSMKSLAKKKCRPFNRITVDGNVLTKEAVDEQGRKLAARECLWYEKAREKNSKILPYIYETNPLKWNILKEKYL